MFADCHIHMILDGIYYKTAIERHQKAPVDSIIRETLAHYQAAGVTMLRDGGDAWGVCKRAKELAPEYAITYLMPLYPIYKIGYYGGFIGRGFETLEQYCALVRQVRKQGGDFIKIMISGLMDFHELGKLSCDSLPRETIHQMIHIAHEEGFSVMAHANGDAAVSAALSAGVDSIEHGSYLREETVYQMAESGCIWVPTLSTVGNLIGDGRFPDVVLQAILEFQLQNLAKVYALGGLIGLGSDACAYRVAHVQGALDEYGYLRRAIGSGLDAHLAKSQQKIKSLFVPQ